MMDQVCQDSQQVTARVQNILHIAHGLREATAASNSPNLSSVKTRLPLMINSINIPSTPPLLPSLLDAGASSEFALTANKIYQRRAEQLRLGIQDSIATACHKAAEIPTFTSALPPDLLMKKLTSIFTKAYVQRLEEWKKQFIRRLQGSTMSAKVAPRSSRAFNHEYVPLLERFFEANPFPTQADKIFLAKKSNMEYKQIHVWFQNRRTRTKKEGKTSTKWPRHEGATKRINKLYQHMNGRVINSDSRAPESSRTGISDETTEINMSKEFPSSSPPHAFPSSYPPTCHYDPFPCKSGPVPYSRPDWRRSPDGKRRPSVFISIDELVEKFSHLNVRDGTHPKGSSKLKSHAATVAITVIPSRAPHPSLIVRKYSQPTNVLRLRSSVCAPVSYSEAFQSASSTSKPVALVPLSAPQNKNELIGKRKIVSLPRRSPGRQYNACRDTIPENSSMSSPSPHLFSTDSESACSFSSASPLSIPSDAATVQELPHLFGSPCRLSFNSPIHLRGPGNAVAISL